MSLMAARAREPGQDVCAPGTCPWPRTSVRPDHLGRNRLWYQSRNACFIAWDGCSDAPRTSSTPTYLWLARGFDAEAQWTPTRLPCHCVDRSIHTRPAWSMARL